jgi:sugar O-acyltransferase (sialic acid O-acetyltransferase NeuD family)
MFRIAAVLDDAAGDPGGEFKGIEVLGGRDALGEVGSRGIARGFVAIGDNGDREQVTRAVLAAGLQTVTLVHPGAHLAESATVGTGTVVMPSVVVAADAQIGDHVILNTGCSVDHDCRVGPFAHLSPGVHVSGECEIGPRAHIGIGASVVNRVRIGQAARIGAGAAVIGDVEAETLVAGVPARPLEVGI